MSATFNPDKTQPYAQWEEVDVTFPAAANTDLEISHSLLPPTAEHVNYIVTRADRAVKVYHNTAFNRKPWQRDYILLRADVASAKVSLFLFVDHEQRTLTF